MRGDSKPRYSDRQFIAFIVCTLLGLAVGVATSRTVSGLMGGVIVGGAVMLLMNVGSDTNQEEP